MSLKEDYPNGMLEGEGGNIEVQLLEIYSKRSRTTTDVKENIPAVVSAIPNDSSLARIPFRRREQNRESENDRECTRVPVELRNLYAQTGTITPSTQLMFLLC